MRPYILAESNWKYIKDASFDVAVLPWGACEAHNYHLPYATDIIESEHIAAEAAHLAWEQGAKVIVLPSIPFGVNTGQVDVKLDINMNPSTQLAVLHDIINYFPKIKIGGIISGHDWYYHDVKKAVAFTIGEIDKYYDDESWVIVKDQNIIDEFNIKIEQLKQQGIYNE